MFERLISHAAAIIRHSEPPKGFRGQPNNSLAADPSFKPNMPDSPLCC
jgi:hypothetical protein